MSNKVIHEVRSEEIINEIVLNPCTDRNVTVNAVAHVVCSVNGNKATVHVNVSNTKGIDEDGNEYTGGWVMNERFDAATREETAITFQATMSGHRLATWILMGVFRATVDPDGHVTIRLDQFRCVCKG